MNRDELQRLIDQAVRQGITRATARRWTGQCTNTEADPDVTAARTARYLEAERQQRPAGKRAPFARFGDRLIDVDRWVAGVLAEHDDWVDYVARHERDTKHFVTDWRDRQPVRSSCPVCGGVLRKTGHSYSTAIKSAIKSYQVMCDTCGIIARWDE